MKRRAQGSKRTDPLCPFKTLVGSKGWVRLPAMPDIDQMAWEPPGCNKHHVDSHVIARPGIFRSQCPRGGCDAGQAALVNGKVQIGGARAGLDLRSEEHTSELQSLMRISYAVFCLKKQKKVNPNIHHQK